MADQVTRGRDGVLRKMVDSGDGTYAMAYSAAADLIGPTDIATRGQDGLLRRMRDNGDGTYSEVVAIDAPDGGGDSTVDGGTP